MQDGDRWEGWASEFRVRMMDRKGGMKSERGVVVTQLRNLGLRRIGRNGVVFSREEGDGDPRQVDDVGGE